MALPRISSFYLFNDFSETNHWHCHSLNRLQYHYSDFKILNRLNFSTLCTILVTFGPVRPEIARVTSARCYGNHAMVTN